MVKLTKQPEKKQFCGIGLKHYVRGVPTLLKMNRGIGIILFAMACAPQNASTSVSSAPNALSRSEQSAGWKLLFDGSTLNSWRGYNRRDVPDNWSAANGILQVAAGKEGDIITREMFRNFDFMVDWKVDPGANSGIMYRGLETEDYIWRTALEMQILDDARHNDGKLPLTSAGSLFAVYPAPRGVVKPAGEWNTARVLVNGNHVEHWLNGIRLFEYELGSPDFNARVAASKFKSMPKYGKSPAGYIGLQAHGDHVEFRNIKIKVLP